MAFIKVESEDMKMAFIEEESEDMKIEETLTVKREDTEKQTDRMALKEERQELNEMEDDFMTGEKSTQTNKKSLKKRARKIICSSHFPCQLCGRPFGSKASLKKHMRFYSGETTHICKVCGKSFICKGNLYLHLNNPFGENPFACPQCEKCVFGRMTDAPLSRNHIVKDLSFNHGIHFCSFDARLGLHTHFHS